MFRISKNEKRRPVSDPKIFEYLVRNISKLKKRIGSTGSQIGSTGSDSYEHPYFSPTFCLEDRIKRSLVARLGLRVVRPSHKPTHPGERDHNSLPCLMHKPHQSVSRSGLKGPPGNVCTARFFGLCARA